MEAQAEEIKEILQKFPHESIIGEYVCDHPEGIIFLGVHYLWFHSREKSTTKRVIEIVLKDIQHIFYQAKEQSLRIEMKGITHFFHSIMYCSELYNLIIGKKQSWYAEYNMSMHQHFKIPATESLIECVHATITSATTRNRPGTLYISQDYVGYTLKLSDEKNFFPISSIRTASKENSLLTAKGIKIVAASGEYYFSGFITRRTHVLEILLDLMNITKNRAAKQKYANEQRQLSSSGISLTTTDSDVELDNIVEKEFIPLTENDSVKLEALRESKVLHDAVQLSIELDQDMNTFLLSAESPHYKSSLSDATPVVHSVQHTMNAIREAGLRLLVDIMDGKETLPSVIPPEGIWESDTQTLTEMAQRTGTRLISQAISAEDTLTPISGGLYTITKTLLQCFLRVKKHFNTLFEYVTGKKHHLVPSLTLKKPVNKLKLYNEQMLLLVNIVPLIVSIAMKPDHERYSEFKVEELLERIKVKSFWYEYQGSLKTFVKLLNSVTAALSKSYQYESSLVRYPVAFMVGAAYAFDSEGAEKRVEEVGKNLDPKLAKLIWNLPDKPFIRFFDHLTIASVDVSRSFVVTPNEPGAQPIHCKIISAKHPPFDVHRLGKPPGQGNSHQHPTSFDLAQLPVILHFHGGGFVSMSPESHEVYLREWARITQAVIISVDYKQAPEYKFPIALNECFNVYKWLIEGNLGFIPRKITLVGDSAGGNLVASTTLKAIASGIRVPESAVLIYPALNLVKMATPSRIINMNDPIVSFGFLQMCLDSYLPSDCNPWDMFISPLYAHDKYLKAFPTTYIMGMAFDPLLDDYVAFTKRLKALGKDVFFKLYEDLPHGVLNMVKLIPDAKKAIDDSGLWLRWSIS